MLASATSRAQWLTSFLFCTKRVQTAAKGQLLWVLNTEGCHDRATKKKKRKDKNQNIAYLPCHSLRNLWRSEEHKGLSGKEEHAHAEEREKPKAEQIPWEKLSVQSFLFLKITLPQFLQIRTGTHTAAPQTLYNRFSFRIWLFPWLTCMLN